MGFCERKLAASAATRGQAMEVPERTRDASSLPGNADKMLDPGARISTQDPQLEKDERESEMSVDPTVITPEALAVSFLLSDESG